MEAIVLAGGLGTRLRSVVSDLPKPMAPVNGRPFLEYLLDFWIEKGVKRFVLAVGFKQMAIVSHFKSFYRQIPVDYSFENTPLGTGGGVFLACEKLLAKEPILLTNGDTFFDCDFSEMLGLHKRKSADLTMSLMPLAEVGRFGTVSISSDGRIERFKSPEHAGSSCVSLINGGVYVVQPDFLKSEKEKWNAQASVSLEGDLFPRWIASGRFLYGVKCEGEFIDIGVPEEYRRCGELFAKLFPEQRCSISLNENKVED